MTVPKITLVKIERDVSKSVDHTSSKESREMSLVVFMKVVPRFDGTRKSEIIGTYAAIYITGMRFQGLLASRVCCYLVTNVLDVTVRSQSSVSSRMMSRVVS